jgi:ABC-type phosphate/phosphonate transport system substrate-binding protein
MQSFAGSFTLLIMALPFLSTSASNQPKPLQIGMTNTFFTERPKSVVEIATSDFKEVMKKTTNLDGELLTKFSPSEVAEKLDTKQLDFGIFHAHEFALVQKKYPDLQPLLIAANKNYVERAYLIVHKNSSAKSIADLRGKKLDMPMGTKQHCRVFLDKHCTDKDSKGLAAFFGSIEKSATQADALDEVAREKVQAAIVDTAGLEIYREVKGPVFAKHLQVLQQSESFPAAVIAYKPGTLDEATRKQFQAGLLKAHLTDQGRDMMKEWNVEAFEPTPKDYAKSLADVLKAYPPQ